jgi:hypothetical protein
LDSDQPLREVSGFDLLASAQIGEEPVIVVGKREMSMRLIFLGFGRWWWFVVTPG